MSQELINHNDDLKKLRDDGYAIEVRSDHLLIHEVPYVNSIRQIKYGILVSDLTSVAGDKTVGPIGQHVAYFIGEHPCNSDGTFITAIKHGSQIQLLAANLEVNHSFSCKPNPTYQDYYEKMTRYISIISAQAQAIDESVTPKPFIFINSSDTESVFHYHDSNSTKSKISVISSKLKGQKIAIIGLGGTGSYILDFIAKTPVQEIHLFDGDVFLQHNAFRSPGAPSATKLQEITNKAKYLCEEYSKMHKNIHQHDYYITVSNIGELFGMDFIFLCLDNSRSKKIIIEKLIQENIPFIDVGIGVLRMDDSLLGHVRTTTCTVQKSDHIQARIPFSEVDIPNDYSNNIQIAELNALNAVLAVIKWKKIFGFYQDAGQEFSSLYSINDGILLNEDSIT